MVSPPELACTPDIEPSCPVFTRLEHRQGFAAARFSQDYAVWRQAHASAQVGLGVVLVVALLSYEGREVALDLVHLP